MIAFLSALLFMVSVPAASFDSTPVSIPDGKDGIHFDDISFSRELQMVLVPAGHTGKLYLIDPATLAMTSVGGFSSSAGAPQKGQNIGISSAASGDGFLFVADHGIHMLDAVPVKGGGIAASVPLAGEADFVRYVPDVHEVWVTEPDSKDQKRIEVFAFIAGPKPALAHSFDIPVPAGPESLTVDERRHQVYTNVGRNVAVIDVPTHRIVAQWPNGCEKSRGTAIDEDRGFLFVACGEGMAVVLNTNEGGQQTDIQAVGSGIDLIDYNPKLAHLYVPSSKNKTLYVLGVSSKGGLSMLGSGKSADRSHCVAADDQNNVWVCDPQHGQLLRYQDSFPSA